jgi:hypothetical protein
VIGQVRLEPFTGIYVFKSIDSFDFGTTELQTFSDTVSIILSNYGTDPLVVNSIAQSQGDFIRVSEHTFPLTLNTFDSVIVKFAFNPTSLGTQTINYLIDNNSSTFTGVELSGYGYEMLAASSHNLFGLSGAQNTGQTVLVDKLTGVGTNLGNSNYSDFVSMAIDPHTNQIYGVRTNAINSQLYRINGQTGDGYFLKYIELPNIFSVAFDSTGSLFATTTGDQIYQIDITTGDPALIVTMPISRISIAFNPLDNQLWGSVRNPIGSPKDRIIKINLLTGDTVLVGLTGFGVNTTDITFSEEGQLFGIKGTGTTVSDLYSINTSSGVGTLIGSIGLSDIKTLGYSLEGVTSVDDNKNEIPNDYALEQNYPNPFNPSTQIKFSLPVNSNVKIIVYNLLGEIVRELTNQDMNAGTHSVQWNADDVSGKKVSSGIYFYELNAAGVNGNQFNQVRKMILLK